MRLVDADALKAKSFGKRGGLIHTSDIDALPTVDAVPVIHGRWINGKCDKCGGDAPFWPMATTYYWSMATTYYLSKFCPHCGARMDGKDGDNHD